MSRATTATQREQILEYLKSGRTLTPRLAEQLFGCMRLAARVNELRKLGHSIETRRMTVTSRGGEAARVAEYRLRTRPIHEPLSGPARSSQEPPLHEKPPSHHRNGSRRKRDSAAGSSSQLSLFERTRFGEVVCD